MDLKEFTKIAITNPKAFGKSIAVALSRRHSIIENTADPIIKKRLAARLAKQSFRMMPGMMARIPVSARPNMPKPIGIVSKAREALQGDKPFLSKVKAKFLRHKEKIKKLQGASEEDFNYTLSQLD
jgi:hypothetical protein